MIKSVFALVVAGLPFVAGMAQPSDTPPSASSSAVACPVPHTSVPFRIADEGEKLPDIQWGLDLAWLSESNLRRGVQFAGEDMIDLVRLSFQTTNSVESGELSRSQKNTLNQRISYVKKWAPKAGINLNSDQEAGVDDWYGSDRGNRWSKLIKLTKLYVEQQGLKVVSVSPFNEPDYTDWKQGTKADFLAICRTLKADPDMAGVLMCGGNTLNDDKAAEWYNACKSALDIGNTHQLAGSFDNFAAFYQLVAADGKIGCDDELHNTMEAMIASNYGLGQAIWWGTCEHTRSQWMKASRGTRLGYAENRDRWTAASVYRHPSTDVHPGGYVQGFIGSSERQANPTDFRFAALDHDVWFDGYGPTREYIMKMPGGTGYQQGQKNAEALVNIQDGDDIMPLIADGSYRIVNRLSGFYMAPQNGTLTNGATMAQVKATSSSTQWNIRRVQRDRGGDFSYITIRNAADTLSVPDLLNWTLDDQGGVICYRGGLGDNEIWYLEYASDGYFYIKSKHSGFCLDLQRGTESQKKSVNRAVVQAPCTGDESQQWRLIPSTAAFNKVAPQAPVALKATPQSGSIRLDWTAGKNENDILQFIVLRSSDQTHWNTINRVASAKKVTTDDVFAYIDNTAVPGQTYYYKVQAQDLSLNRSADSDIIQAATSDEHGCVMHLTFDETFTDATENGNHAAFYGTAAFEDAALGKGLTFTGKEFVQLPTNLISSDEFTLCGWFYLDTSTTGTRLFDFSLDDTHYLYLTPRTATGTRLVICNGEKEQSMAIGSTFTTRKLIHLAVTFTPDAITVYRDGQQVTQNIKITIRPKDFKPAFNYIGRSLSGSEQWLKGRVDDVRIYNYALSADEVAAVYGTPVGIRGIDNSQWTIDNSKFKVQSSKFNVESSSILYDLSGRKVSNGQSVNGKLSHGIYVTGGRKVVK